MRNICTKFKKDRKKLLENDMSANNSLDSKFQAHLTFYYYYFIFFSLLNKKVNEKIDNPL